ncbi:hypothetical protein GOP47_0011830 [Adiantum capillus-veneris]|uniref:Uncharacterized protein n=1 Tax=Adiantum capillus-veneris TaxID=13818 RepID=A0A9D4UTY9_ADICA|nr:hypothetical protein GOP47_0011830 [Adiantum capillus-veneris]
MAHTHKCCQKQKLKRGLWSPDEDEKLLACIMQHGPGSWSSVPALAGIQRCGKSCRLRWINYLRPDLKRGSFSATEEKRIIELHAIFGNKWSKIASHLPGRTDNEIKNLWNSCLKKRVQKKIAQSNNSGNAVNAHDATKLKQAELVAVRACPISAASSSCMPPRPPIFPFSQVDFLDADQCGKSVLPASYNIAVKPHLEIAPIARGNVDSQHIFFHQKIVHPDQLLDVINMPRQEADQFLVKLAQFPDYKRLQSLEPMDQGALIIVNNYQAQMDGLQPMDIKGAKHCQDVGVLQQQGASGYQPSWKPDHNLVSNTPYALHANTCDYVKPNVSEQNPFGVISHDSIFCSTADCNVVHGDGHSLRNHLPHNPTAPADLGIPYGTLRLCELGPLTQSPSTTCSDDSSKISSLLDYQDVDFWLDEACTKATCYEFC